MKWESWCWNECKSFEPWPNVKFLWNIVEFSFMVASVLLWHGSKCLYYSITLNKPLMSVRKNILQIVSRLLPTFDLLHSIDHQLQSKSTLEFPRGSRSSRNHKPLKILTDLLMRTRNSCEEMRFELELEWTKLEQSFSLLAILRSYCWVLDYEYVQELTHVIMRVILYPRSGRSGSCERRRKSCIFGSHSHTHSLLGE